MEYLISTENLTKVFGRNEVVSNVNLHVKKGEIYGFLGPNGAGKSTVMKLITNLIKPTSGSVRVFGSLVSNSSYDMFKDMGIIIEAPVFYENLSCYENLKMHCDYMGYYEYEAIDKALAILKLENINNTLVKALSLGMKQRLAIARSIITQPKLLLLDEPINGLDPNGIKEIRAIFKRLNSEYGTTILISSHILSEVEQIADTIGIISNGKLIEELSMETIRKNSLGYIELDVDNANRAAVALNDFLENVDFKVLDDTIRVYNSTCSSSKILEEMVRNNVAVNSIVNKKGTLEDYYLKITERGSCNA